MSEHSHITHSRAHAFRACRDLWMNSAQIIRISSCAHQYCRMKRAFVISYFSIELTVSAAERFYQSSRTHRSSVKRNYCINLNNRYRRRAPEITFDVRLNGEQTRLSFERLLPRCFDGFLTQSTRTWNRRPIAIRNTVTFPQAIHRSLFARFLASCTYSFV